MGGAASTEIPTLNVDDVIADGPKFRADLTVCEDAVEGVDMWLKVRNGYSQSSNQSIKEVIAVIRN